MVYTIFVRVNNNISAQTSRVPPVVVVQRAESVLHRLPVPSKLVVSGLAASY